MKEALAPTIMEITRTQANGNACCSIEVQIEQEQGHRCLINTNKETAVLQVIDQATCSGSTISLVSSFRRSTYLTSSSYIAKTTLPFSTAMPSCLTCKDSNGASNNVSCSGSTTTSSSSSGSSSSFTSTTRGRRRFRKSKANARCRRRQREEMKGESNVIILGIREIVILGKTFPVIDSCTSTRTVDDDQSMISSLSMSSAVEGNR